ncbi:MAG: hypothetical protein ACJASL_004730 [Paraglaciecola sp.]|jgi:hypothetical protein
MKNVLIILFTVFSFTTLAQERLEVYQDYDLGTEITLISTIKIDANMKDIYLAGLRSSWVKAVSVQKELGFIKDWKILASDLPQSGEFNMITMVMFDSAADLEPSKKKYTAIMKKLSEDARKQMNQITAKYPEVRTITGEYRMREIILK